MSSTVSAVILAAGYGTRLDRDVRADSSGAHAGLIGLSKALVPVGGTTVLGHWLRQLGECHVDQVAIVTNHAHVNQFTKEIVPANVRVVDDLSASNADRLGAVADLQLALDSFRSDSNCSSDSDFVVIAGDTLFHRDFHLRDVLAEFSRLRAEKYAAPMAFGVVVYYVLSNHDEVAKRGVVELDDDSGRITKFLEKPHPSATQSNNAVPAFYVYSHECKTLLSQFIAETPTMEARDAPGTFLQWLIAQGTPTHAMRIAGRYDIGGLTDLLAARADLGNSLAPSNSN